MLDIVFNRKIRKALELLDKEIELYKRRRDWFKDEILRSKDESFLPCIDDCQARISALKTLRTKMRSVL